MARQAKMELTGAKELKQAFASIDRSILAEVKTIIRESADEVRREARSRIAVSQDKHPSSPYPSGSTRRNVFRNISKDGLSAEVGNKWFVARWLEFGTKARKTKSGANRGTMHARPWLFPSWEIVRPKVLKRMEAALYGVLRGRRAA